MTLPAGVVRRVDGQEALGVVLALYPSDPEFGVEIQRAPDDGSGDPDTGSAVTAGFLEPGGGTFVDLRPSQDELWHYRARHARENYTAGEWTNWVAAKAREIPRVLPPRRPRPPLFGNLVLHLTTNQLSVFLRGDLPAKSVHWAVRTDGNWPDLDSEGSCANLDSAGDFESLNFLALSLGQSARLEARFFDEANCAGNVVGTIRDVERADQQMPRFSVETAQSGNVGSVIVREDDPQNRVVARKWAKHDPDTATTYDFSDPTDGHWSTFTENQSLTVAIREKHPSLVAVAFQVTQLDGTTAWQIIPRIVFDADDMAQVLDIAVTYDVNGVVYVTTNGDADTSGGYFSVGIGSPPSDPTASSFHGIWFGRGAAGVISGITAALGAEVIVKARGYNADSELGPVATARFRRGDAVKHRPHAQFAATRIGDSVIVSLTVADPTLSVTGLQRRDQPSGGSLTSYTTWGTAGAGEGGSGTPGVSTTLTRSYLLTAAQGLSAQFGFLLTYTREDGSLATIGDEIDVSRLTAVTKTLVFFPSGGSPLDETMAWTTNGLLLRSGTVGGTLFWYIATTLPQGVVLTQVRQRMLKANAADAVQAQLVVATNETTPVTILSTLLPMFTGFWHWTTGFLAQTVGAEETYFVIYQITPNANVADAAVGRLELTYTTPSYEKSY